MKFGIKIRAVIGAAVTALIAVSAGGLVADTPAAAAGSSTVRTAQLQLDDVSLTVAARAIPGAFTVSPSGDLIQTATASTMTPYAAISLTAVPYGYADPAEASLGEAGPNAAATWLTELTAFRTSQGGRTGTAPTATLFGKAAVGIQTHDKIAVDGIHPIAVDIDEWVVPAGQRLWLIRAEQAAGTGTLAPDLTVTSTNVATPSTILNTPKPATTRTQASVITPMTAGNLPTPAWWSGVCDVGNHSVNYQLGTTTYRGMQACGPRLRDRPDGQSEPMVSIGGWGEYEWECVELSMRYLFEAGYVTNGYEANGNTVVAHYNGTKMVAKSNGVAGSSPQPGDVVSMGFDTTNGHTAVVYSNNVNASGDGTIGILQENSTTNGIDTMTVNNWVVTATVGTGVSWLHDPTSTSTSGRTVGDYDGGGRTDLALYRQDCSAGSSWWVNSTETGNAVFSGATYGGCTDIPAPGDYDGDGVTDRALFRRDCVNGSTWWITSGRTGATIYAGLKFGGCNDIPAPGDYDGDGVTDLALYRPDCTNGSNWWVTSTRTGNAIYSGSKFGGCADIPAPGDYDNDGYTDRACTGRTARMVRIGGCRAPRPVLRFTAVASSVAVLISRLRVTTTTMVTPIVRCTGRTARTVRAGG